MINLKCRYSFMRGQDFRCVKKRKVITNCKKDCKDFVMSYAWQQLLFYCDPDYKKWSKNKQGSNY